MIYHLPIKTVTGLNAREHWRKRAARVKAERHTTAIVVKPFPVPCIVRMVRETCRFVAFQWESYRPKARKEDA